MSARGCDWFYFDFYQHVPLLRFCAVFGHHYMLIEEINFIVQVASDVTELALVHDGIL